MTALKRLIHRTWSTTPAILRNWKISPDQSIFVQPRKLTSTRFVDIYQGSSGETNQSYFGDSLNVDHGYKARQSKNSWETNLNFSFFLTSSSSMIRSSISLNKASQFSTSSLPPTTKTTYSQPQNSSSGVGGGGIGVGGIGGEEDNISFTEAKRLMRLVDVEALKIKLGMEGKEVIEYSELLEACKSMGVAKSANEATAFARVLDEAGVILLFRDKVYLHPDKVLDLVRKAVPLALTSEDDPRRDEFKTLLQKKEEIDVLAHKQVRRILWSGLGLGVLQVSLFFRLTYWEFSWDVMEPIAFFTTTLGIIIGYAYFLFTRKDPTYQDLMKRLFLSRQRKIIQNHNFNVDRFMELQKKCNTPLDLSSSINNKQAKTDFESGNVFYSR